jgi:hypothetical protein
VCDAGGVGLHFIEVMTTDGRAMMLLSFGRQTVLLECSVNSFLETLQVFMDDDSDLTLRRLNRVVSGNDVYHVRLAIDAARGLPGIKKVFYESGRVFIGPSRGRWIEFCRIY